MSEPSNAPDPLDSPLARAAFEAAAVGLLLLDAEGMVIAMNGTFGRLYGIDPGAMVGCHYTSFSQHLEVRRLDRPIDEEAWITQRALRGERVEGVLQSIRNRASDREFVARCGAVPVFEEGRVRAVTVTVEDVTESVRDRQRVEAALSAAEVGTWRTNLAEGRVWADANFARIYGLTEDEARGGNVDRLYQSVHPDDRERVAESLRQAAEAGVPHEFEYRIVLPDGGVRWLLSRGQTERNERGFVAKRLGSIVDVTERKRAEGEANRAAQRYRALAEAAASIVFATDAEGHLTAVLLARGIDRPEGSTSGIASLIALVHPDDRVALYSGWQRVVSTGEPYFAELRLRMEDGGYRWHAARGVAVPGEDGSTREWVGAVTDVHERTEAVEALREANARLEQRVEERTAELTRANRDLGEFSHSVAHDLRAPLRAIVSTSRMLLEDLEDRLRPDERETLKRQATNAVRLAKIVDDLLDFARLAKADLRREPFDLTLLARHVAADVKSRRKEPCEIEIQDDMHAEGDENLVGYALTNLIDNACKFSPKGGKVTVGESQEGFFVRDQGVGFDMAHADKLFVAFERLVPQESFEGTGVGLANVKRIVERHGGMIWAESEPGQGATFWFTLG